MIRVGFGSDAGTLPFAALEAQSSHRPLDTPLAHRHAFLAERGDNTRASVRTAALRVGLFDLSLQLNLGGSHCRLPLHVGVVPLPSHAKETAHRGDRKRLLRGDERELHSLSFAKKAAA